MAAIVERPKRYNTGRKPGRTTRPIPIKPGVAAGLPYNHEAERLLLGKLLVYPEHVPTAMEILCASDFDNMKHQAIYGAMVRIHERGDVPTAALVDEELSKASELGQVTQLYVHELTNGLSPFDDTVALSIVVQENGLRRDEMAIGNELTQGLTTAALAVGRLELLQQRRMHRSRSAYQESPGVLIEAVERQEVSWLWHRRIARGKVTILDGDPGVGKGLLTLDIAARLSRGARLPHDPRPAAQPGGVLLFTPEDDVADTIRPRLEAAGADLSRVRFLASMTRYDPETGETYEQLLTIPRDVHVFEDVIMREGIELLIIDPITAVLDAGVKTNNDAEVRGALMPLSLMAARTGCGVLIVRHLNKSGGDNAIYRGGGSIAFTGLARIGLLLTPHPDGDAKRVLAPVKSNIGRPGDALSFALVSDPPDAIPHLVWDDGACEYDAHTLLATRVSDQRRDIVQVFRDAGDGAELSPNDVAVALGVDGEPAKASSIRRSLVKMRDHGALVSRSYGKYSLPPTLSQ